MCKRKRRTEKFKKNKPTRRCHDCGHPTSNYRCNECWKKLREKGGYLPAGEVVDLGCKLRWRDSVFEKF